MRHNFFKKQTQGKNIKSHFNHKKVKLFNSVAVSQEPLDVNSKFVCL